MSETNDQARSGAAVEAALRDELIAGNAVIGTIAPVLRHLLTNADHALLSDEVVARVRGMSADLARQLLNALDDAGAGFTASDEPAQLVEPLQQRLIAQAGLLSHLHALAIEWQLTEQLHARLSIDPALPPLLQSRMASADSAEASAAMALLAAQVRFAQAQRRMQLALTELPADLFHLALQMLGTVDVAPDAVERASATLRAGFDEGRSRLALMTRLSMGPDTQADLTWSVHQAGVGLFLTALALSAGIERDQAVLATSQSQAARFALMLRAAAVPQPLAEQQFLAIHPESALPEGWQQLGVDRAAALLARASIGPGG